jgi:DNA-directed RNA polymerase specialized sigma24 family protein
MTIEKKPAESFAQEVQSLQFEWFTTLEEWGTKLDPDEQRREVDKNFKKYYEKVEKRLMAKIVRALGKRADEAQDVFQEVFIDHVRACKDAPAFAKSALAMLPRMQPPEADAFLQRRTETWRAHAKFSLRSALTLPEQCEQGGASNLNVKVNAANEQLHAARVEGVSIVDRYLSKVGLTVPVTKSAKENFARANREAPGGDESALKAGALEMARAYDHRFRNLMKLDETDQFSVFCDDWPALVSAGDSALMQYGFDAGKVAYWVTRTRFQQYSFLVRSAESKATDWHRPAGRIDEDSSSDDQVESVEQADFLRRPDEYWKSDPMRTAAAEQAFERIEQLFSEPLLLARERLAAAQNDQQRKKLEAEVMMQERINAVFDLYCEGLVVSDREKGYTGEEIAKELDLPRDKYRTADSHMTARLNGLAANLSPEIQNGK